MSRNPAGVQQVDIELEGFDEAQRELEDLARRAEKLEGEQEVALTELLAAKFLQRHTAFSSLEAMLEASGWEVESQEDFEAIPDDEWDRFVAANSDFPDWQAMLSSAGEEWAVRQLGLGD